MTIRLYHYYYMSSVGGEALPALALQYQNLMLLMSTDSEATFTA